MDALYTPIFGVFKKLIRELGFTKDTSCVVTKTIDFRGRSEPIQIDIAVVVHIVKDRNGIFTLGQ
jgi:hypothetical protein